MKNSNLPIFITKFRVVMIIIQIFRKVIRNISNSFEVSVVRGNTSGDSEQKIQGGPKINTEISSTILIKISKLVTEQPKIWT